MNPAEQSGPIQFRWRLLYACNYRCPYCFNYSRRDSHKRKETYISAAELGRCWERMFKKFGILKVHLEGGEPSIYPSFVEIIKRITDKHKVAMTTNLSGNFETFVNEVDPSRIEDWIEACFHPIHACYNEFLKKAAVLKNNGFPIRINFSCYPPQLKLLEYYKQKFESEGFQFMLVPFQGNYRGKQYPRSYSKQERESLYRLMQDNKKFAENFKHQLEGISTKGKLCRAGQKYAFIDSDGFVFRCSRAAMDRANSEILGNILNEDICLLEHPSPCTNEGCSQAYSWLVDRQGQEILANDLINLKVNDPSSEISPENNDKILDFKKKVATISLPYSAFFNWDIHYSCNCRCSYCFFAGKWEEVAGGNVYPGIQKWIDIWRRLYEKYGECRIDISGGEPTTYPSFFELIAQLCKMHRVRFNTNLSFNVAKFVSNFLPIITKRSLLAVEVSSSFHPEGVSFEDFFKKLIILRDAGFKLLVSYVAYPPQLDKMYEIKKKIENSNIPFIIQPFRGKYNGRTYPKEYTEEERKIFEQCSAGMPSGLFEHHLYNKKNEQENKLCRMGQVYAKIHPNGEAFRCCAPGAQRLGNLIRDNHFTLLDAPDYCDLSCPCWKAMIVGKESDWKHNWNE